MSVTALINGIDISTQLLAISGTFQGWLGAPASTRGIMNMPSRVRSKFSNTDQVAQRPVPIPVKILATTLAQRLAALDWIKAQFRTTIVLRMADGLTTRELVGVITNIDMEPRMLANNTVCDGLITVLAVDPTWREINAVQYILGTARFQLPMGSAPVEDWLIELMNSAGTVTNPNVIIRNGSGTILYTLALTGTITTTQHVTADGDNSSAVRESAGVTTSVISSWAGGFPTLTVTDQMTIELSASSGTPVGVLRYVLRSW